MPYSTKACDTTIHLDPEEDVATFDFGTYDYVGLDNGSLTICSKTSRMNAENINQSCRNSWPAKGSTDSSEYRKAQTSSCHWKLGCERMNS